MERSSGVGRREEPQEVGHDGIRDPGVLRGAGKAPLLGGGEPQREGGRRLDLLKCVPTTVGVLVATYAPARPPVHTCA